MKYILDELFETWADFQEIIPGVDSTLSFKTLNGSAVGARKQIINIISETIYRQILQADGDIRTELCMALGNLTMHKELPFDILRRRKANTDVYRHEQNNMERSYLDNYYNAMDGLISSLDAGRNRKIRWKETAYYRMREQLRITDVEEFNTLYPIDNSSLFFFRTLPLQRELLDETFEGYFERAQEFPVQINRLKRALVQMVVSLALSRFDLQEFPACIRNHKQESTLQRHSANEQSHLERLAATLRQTALNTLRTIDLILEESTSGSIDTETSFNLPDDKIIVLP